MADTEGHRGGFRGYAQFVKQPGEQRIGDMVEHHEPSIDWQNTPGAGFLGCQRIRVAARIVALFEDREVEMSVEKMGAPETCNAGADDR